MAAAAEEEAYLCIEPFEMWLHAPLTIAPVAIREAIRHSLAGYTMGTISLDTILSVLFFWENNGFGQCPFNSFMEKVVVGDPIYDPTIQNAILSPTRWLFVFRVSGGPHFLTQLTCFILGRLSCVQKLGFSTTR